MIEKLRKFPIEAKQRDGSARHVEGRAIRADPGRVRLQPRVLQPRRQPPIHDEQLHVAGSAEGVHEDGHAVASARRHLRQQAVDDVVDDRVGKLELLPADTRLTVNAHADLDLIRPDLKVRPERLGERAGT